ncbi:AAA family ATPase [Aureimonas ureilytica]|uniref:AAA family ATPase n=1 Tax=Aureimonas ureilytica TaxID=401562 RepID=UPI003CF16866
MLTKIVVKNVGVLKDFNTPNGIKPGRLTIFHARNGRGKTTLTSILRAARDGASEPIHGRRSLGSPDMHPEVTLVGAGGTLRFTESGWSGGRLPAEVFDTAFIAENVYAGEMPDLTHDRGLFSVIVGHEGVRLGKRLEFFANTARAAGLKVKAAAAALDLDRPSDLPLEEFVALNSDHELDTRIADAERVLRSVQQAKRVASLRLLDRLEVPLAPDGLRAMLAATVADVDTSARERLVGHFRRFGLGVQGAEWARFGLDHVHDGACPMCGRDGADELGIVSLYSKVFSDSYRNHMAAVEGAAAHVDRLLGPAAVEAATRRVAENAILLRDWSEFRDLRAAALPDVTNLSGALATAYRSLSSVVSRKRATPLDAVDGGIELDDGLAAVARAASLVELYNSAIDTVNVLLAASGESSMTTQAQAERALKDLERRRARRDPGVERRVREYERARRREERAKRARTVCQTRLKSANNAAAAHFHERVNYHLGRFGATFAISGITNSMAGNAGSTDYGLVVRGNPIERGRRPGPEDRPSFRNTLSAGDKTTLAFAFFLAKLERDPRLAERIVVFDDPLSSHDSQRKGKTVEALRDLGRRCLQVFVLSHDEWFVRDLCRASHDLAPVVYGIEFEGPERWSRASPRELSALCVSQHESSIRALHDFLELGAGEAASVVLHVRQVLETHFRRSYRAWFGPDEDLGAIVLAIARDGATHPCHSALDKLRGCNEATRERHHGEDARLRAGAAVDPDELRVVVADALGLIRAIRV